MKLRAFAQAVCLFLLLLAPVVFLLVSQRDPAPPIGSDSRQNPSAPTGQDPPGPAPSESLSPPEPDGIVDWETVMIGLRQADGPAAEKKRLRGLREWLQSLGPATAVQEIRRFLDSGENTSLAQRFRVGPGGKLVGAPSLRSTLLDWLGRWNPEAAATIGRGELTSAGTALPPSEYVLHLRNVAWASAGDRPRGSDRTFLLTHTRALLRHDPWMRDPTAAVAEAMDVVVYLEAVSLLPEVTGLLQKDNPPGMRAAAALGLERLVDRRPLEVLPELMEADVPSVQRASSFARLHAANAEARRLLRAYLNSASIRESEKRTFLDYYPNLNNAISHNLLSRQFLNTDLVSADKRLRAAAAMVEQWLEAPALSGLYPRLKETKRRLQRQMHGKPAP